MQQFLEELQRITVAANLAANYEKTLALLRALKAGGITLDQVTLGEGGWNVAPAVDPNAAVVEKLLARGDAIKAGQNGDGQGEGELPG